MSYDKVSEKQRLRGAYASGKKYLERAEVIVILLSDERNYFNLIRDFIRVEFRKRRYGGGDFNLRRRSLESYRSNSLESKHSLVLINM
jgi:hypothetical protein